MKLSNQDCIDIDKLKQALSTVRAARDKVVAQDSVDILGHAYRVVSVQGEVNQAKKALYIKLRQVGQDIKHKDI